MMDGLAVRACSGERLLIVESYSKILKYIRLGLVAQSVVFDDLGRILNNQLSFSRIAHLL